jgi:hypothetical protein
MANIEVMRNKGCHKNYNYAMTIDHPTLLGFSTFPVCQDKESRRGSGKNYNTTKRTLQWLGVKGIFFMEMELIWTKPVSLLTRSSTFEFFTSVPDTKAISALKGILAEICKI